MAQPRRARKIDKSQQGIVGTLRSYPNITVELDHDDILVGYNLQNYWFELKSKDKVSKKTGQILQSAKKPSQKRLERTWMGQYSIVSTVEEILSIIGYRNR